MKFLKDYFTTNQVLGAVADAVIRDFRVNNFTFSGFPQIHIDYLKNDIFKITLSIESNGKNEARFELSYSEAKAVARVFSENKRMDRRIFKRVQSAIVTLERKADEVRCSTEST